MPSTFRRKDGALTGSLIRHRLQSDFVHFVLVDQLIIGGKEDNPYMGAAAIKESLLMNFIESDIWYLRIDGTKESILLPMFGESSGIFWHRSVPGKQEYP